MSTLSHFFAIHNFIFHFPLLCCVPCKRKHPPDHCGSSVGSIFYCGSRSPGFDPGEVLLFLLIMTSVMALETIKCRLFLKSLCLFFPLFTFENKMSVLWPKLNYWFFYVTPFQTFHYHSKSFIFLYKGMFKLFHGGSVRHCLENSILLGQPKA
jgi:hypothetical protein